MAISARNVFKGTVTHVTTGAVNTEVEITLPGGDVIVAIVTEASAKSLGLAEGKEAVAFVKAPWVTLLTGNNGIKFSARNQLVGSVEKIVTGAVNSEVYVALPGGAMVIAIVTNEAISELELGNGKEVTALIKASHVIVGTAS